MCTNTDFPPWTFGVGILAGIAVLCGSVWLSEKISDRYGVEADFAFVGIQVTIIAVLTVIAAVF